MSNWQHGEYKRVTHAQVMADSQKRDYTIVSVDSIIARMSGGHVLHIVAAPDFWTMDEPIGYSVELIRPIWMYGNEGHLCPLEFIGRLEDSWTETLDAGVFSETSDPFPDCSDFIWAMPNRMSRYPEPDVSAPWKHVEGYDENGRIKPGPTWRDALRAEAAS